MSVFDDKAAQWESKGRRIELARDVVSAVIKYAKPDKGIKLADFGTGTGLIMLGLADYASEMTGFDTSEGMLDVLRTKAADARISNMTAKFFDVGKEDFPAEEFDLMTCSMVAHHLEHPEIFFAKAYEGLKTCGKLCVADLVLTEAPFHDTPHEGVMHGGFDTERIKESLLNCGFRDVQIYEASKITKERNGQQLEFPVFLAVAEK